MTGTATAERRDEAGGESIVGLFQADILAPAQYFDGLMKEQVRAPERDLALAMLEDAVMCFKKYLKSTREKERHIFDETEEWFLRDDQHWVFSFLNLCDFLGLDAGFLRQGTSSLEGRCFERPGRGHFQSRDGARRYLE